VLKYTDNFFNNHVTRIFSGSKFHMQHKLDNFFNEKETDLIWCQWQEKHEHTQAAGSGHSSGDFKVVFDVPWSVVCWPGMGVVCSVPPPPEVDEICAPGTLLATGLLVDPEFVVLSWGTVKHTTSVVDTPFASLPPPAVGPWPFTVVCCSVTVFLGDVVLVVETHVLLDSWGLVIPSTLLEPLGCVTPVILVTDWAVFVVVPVDLVPDWPVVSVNLVPACTCVVSVIFVLAWPACVAPVTIVFVWPASVVVLVMLVACVVWVTFAPDWLSCVIPVPAVIKRLVCDTSGVLVDAELAAESSVAVSQLLVVIFKCSSNNNRVTMAEADLKQIKMISFDEDL
jgi:hypothetical protein